MAEAEMNYVHIIINMANTHQLQILLKFIRNYPMYSYM
jgi:endo-1,4-beta-mannosidase